MDSKEQKAKLKTESSPQVLALSADASKLAGRQWHVVRSGYKGGALRICPVHLSTPSVKPHADATLQLIEKSRNP